MRAFLPLLSLVLIGCEKPLETVESFGLRYELDSSNNYRMSELANVILAVEDFDADGQKDLLLGGDNQGTAAKTSLYVMKNLGNGRWQDITGQVLTGAPVAANPYGVVNDFNGDNTFDVAIFDKGNMELGQDPTDGGFYGEEPLLLLSQSNGTWSPSDALETANYSAITSSGQYTYNDNRGLHAKSATSGDIDNDGDIDLFIESGGGWHQMWPHLSVNQGDGTYVSDGEHTRLPLDIVRGASSGSWRYQTHTLADLNSDGYLDLVMGQLRKQGNDQDDLASKVVFNNGSGVFPIANVVDFPYPDFNDGWAYATSLAVFDFNDDSHLDVIIAYQRANNGTSADNTGCYLQVLLNNGDQTFQDASSTYITSQSMTAAQHSTYGAFINSPFQLIFKDMNGDGHEDLVMPKSTGYFSNQFPFMFINDGSNRFTPLNDEALTREEFQGANSYPIDIDGNDKVDIVTLDSVAGSDESWGTADDQTVVVTRIAR